ncbi:uncharacterized protein BO80DRAFT_68594 [Aspergillus ibericus CBS 121593]|uniref:Uncharacterized protein n=1 Tax=Aspergillus ibericus CBS 121593 TaxID=1448316 RepID=A0A395H2F1_9EURO|nr:hypothetical protein BO80DRAFT_68594 [Aspergillus ibericus CBS 121593]RAL01028.1 hypothetical protein BO80DRAFT_68594 [Aspergillus ibericus CBS 121593]
MNQCKAGCDCNGSTRGATCLVCFIVAILSAIAIYRTPEEYQIRRSHGLSPSHIINQSVRKSVIFI